MTNPVGRPTDYRAEYCERVIALGKEGKSKAQMALILDVDCKTIDNWADAHPEFFLAFTRARDYSKAWWEDKGQDNLTAQTFQTGLWSRSMAARFPDDYAERREITGKDGKDLLPTAIEIVGISAK